jgi:predicted RNA polymerase sigma factor
VQEACVRALERWTGDQVPERVDGWLVRVAHNLAIDAIRHERAVARDPSGHPAVDEADLQSPAPPAAPELDDDLRLIFLCCLKVACGFTVPQIALAFLAEEKTLAQRIVRAKQRLRQEGARFELPAAADLPGRLESILDVLYLVFNEGYSPTDRSEAIVEELCAEALRLARMVAELPATATPAAEALCALFCLQSSRAPARMADDGSLLLLPEQDRARWDAALIEEGFARLERAARGSELSRFHLEAGIAACHAAAPSYQDTDWGKIVFLYDALRTRSPSPVVEVNRAVAVAMHSGALAGIDELDAIPERELVAGYPYALAAYAELHAALDRLDEARAYLRRALARQPSGAQRKLLERKLAALER